ncbi:uncharacterized protein [Dysidea avara]|uniref:uncharacterized protein isoform X1 n=1 Tax=Dysidea avara TaxID=196820 RepID=UPI0033214C6E
MERLWSFLRPFSRMSKEMGSSHRIDVLSDAILYYGHKAIDNIGKLISKRFDHAQTLNGECDKELNELMEMSPVPFTIDNVAKWEQEERSQLLEDLNSVNVRFFESWKAKYVKLIDLHAEIRVSISSINVSEENTHLVSQLCEQLNDYEDKLSGFEHSHGVNQRWSPSSTEYHEVKALVASENRTHLLIKIEQAARERWFLLRLKAKYADGLSIAVRLSRRITTVNSHMKAMLNNFNEGLPVDDRMSWEAACNIHHHSYTASLTNPVDSIPLEVKHEAVQKFQTIVRSNEEMMLLTQEMSNCLEYYEKQILQLTSNHQGIMQLMNSKQSQDINKLSGCSCLIAKKIALFSRKHSDLQSIFQQYIPGMSVYIYSVF